MKMNRMAIGWLVLVTCGCVTFGGCRADRTQHRSFDGLRLRMIESGAESVFDIDSVRHLESAPLADLISDDGGKWETRETDEVVIAPDRIEISGGRPIISLQRDVEWTADDIDAFSFDVSNLTETPRGFRIYWARANEVFSEERMIKSVLTSPGTALMTMAGHPQWFGEIRTVRIDIPSPTQNTTILRSMAPMIYEFDSQAVVAAAESFWKIDLDDDLRRAGLVSSDRPLTWNLNEFAGGVLDFSYELIGSPRGEVQLTVEVVDRDGNSDIVYRGGGKLLADADILWRDVSVDVSEFGPIRELRFGLDRAGRESGFRGLGAIANPTIGPKDSKNDKPNVLLISLDTLRADRLKPYGYSESTSPAIDARAAESGVIFNHAVAASPRTLPSHTSMFTGLDCVSHGVNHYAPAPVGLETLAEVLHEHGYLTIATVGGGLMNPEFGLDQGFDEYYHYSGWTGGFEELEVEVEHAFDMLTRAVGKPFFMFFHTYEIHDPFQARSPFSDHCYEGPENDPVRDLIFGAVPRQRSEADRLKLMFDLVQWKNGQPFESAVPADQAQLELVNCLYDSGISYADAQVDRLLDLLDQRGVLDDTIVVITSDHGEALGEKGLYKHAYLYENNLMIPLMVFLPGGRHGGTTIDQQVATVDIMPTILDVLEIDAPGGIDGESLLPLIEDDDATRHRPEAWSYAAFENRGVSIRIDDQIKYIFNNTAPSSAHGEEEVFKLIDDPEEGRNLGPEDPEMSARLRNRLASYFESQTVGTPFTIDNTGCDRVVGTLTGHSLTTRLKALDLDDDSLSRLSDNQVELSIRRDKRMQLFLEASDLVEIELRATGCGVENLQSTLERTVHLEHRDAAMTIGLRGDTWLEFGDDDIVGDDDTSVVVRVGGRSEGAGSVSGAVQDEAVLEQLRSLGYVE